jgi:hypothetical protein
MDHEVSKVYAEDADKTAKPLTYVAGDSKLSQKWKSAWLALPLKAGLTDMDRSLSDPPGQPVKKRTVDRERLLPLGQLATYCRYAGTRYAFLITQEEVVALRFRRTGKLSAVTYTAAVEYAAVPWSATAKDGLTANLALWALGCMAMNDRHRAMEGPNHEPPSTMARLTWWQFDKTHGFYENVISKRRISATDWHPNHSKFVHLDEKGGQSFTDKFTSTTPVPKIPQSFVAGQDPVKDLTKKMGGMNLRGAATSSAVSSSTAGPSTVANASAPFKTCTIGKATYALHMKDGKYYIYQDDNKKQPTWINKDDKNKHAADIKGKTVAVKMLP